MLVRLLRAIVAVTAMWCVPKIGNCPPGYDLRTGIRRSGEYECWPHPMAPKNWDGRLGPVEDWDGTYLRPERSLQSDRTVHGRIYCTNGTQPVVVNERTVGCQR